jgi:hypothetical protein
MTIEAVHQLWWFVIPLSWIAFAGYQSWLKDAARRDAIETLKAFAMAGREPPVDLVAKLNAR